MQYTITLQDGEEVKVEGRKFAHYIGNIRQWFIVHHYQSPFVWTITELDSGLRVMDIPQMTLQACRGDVKAAAKLALDHLVEKNGADRVNTVIRERIQKTA